MATREGEGMNIFLQNKLKDLNAAVKQISLPSCSGTVLRSAELFKVRNVVAKQASVSVQVAKTC